MNTTMDMKEVKDKLKNAEKTLSGVATDIADKCKTSPKMVDEMTKQLNNNHAGDSDKE